jgi:hypothetical protein
MIAFLLMLAAGGGAAANGCYADRAALLALDQKAFDQDLTGGWRAVAAKPGCELAAADLVRDYRARRGSKDAILFWHEGQLRATAGQSAAAISLFEQSRHPQPDAVGWNLYVDATIAFLRHDRKRLLSAREMLAHLPRPPSFNPSGPDGRPLAISWPMNLNVVDGFLACFGKSYEQAYGPGCTKPMYISH